MWNICYPLLGSLRALSSRITVAFTAIEQQSMSLAPCSCLIIACRKWLPTNARVGGSNALTQRFEAKRYWWSELATLEEMLLNGQSGLGCTSSASVAVEKGSNTLMRCIARLRLGNLFRRRILCLSQRPILDTRTK